MEKWIIALTGASGMKYGLRLIESVAQTVAEVHVVISEAGLRVLYEEEEIKVSQSTLSTKAILGKEFHNVYFYNPKDIGAVIASGSSLFQGMVICPCTMGTLGAISAGLSQNLIHRAADVTLKEGRKLILVPRETPLSAIHLENMLKMSRLGVSIVPAMPGFYHNPKSIQDLVDMQVMKIMDHMGLQNELAARWDKKLCAQVPSNRKVVELRRDNQIT